MMNFRKLFVIGAAVAALGVAGASMAQTNAQKSMIDEAKVEGVVGEQADGYLGFRSGSSDSALQEAVRVTTAARREAYAARAAETGVSTEVAAARMFEALLRARLADGEWYRNAQGQWVQN